MDHSLKTRGDPGSEHFEVRSYPFFQLNRAANRYNQLIEAELRSIGLEVLAWRVLMILGEQAPLPAAKVADLAVINLSTLTRLIARMKKVDLVDTRTSSSDRRVTEIQLTQTGQAKLLEARKLTAPFYGHAIDGFSEEELASFLEMLRRLHGNLAAAPATIELEVKRKAGRLAAQSA